MDVSQFRSLGKSIRHEGVVNICGQSTCRVHDAAALDKPGVIRRDVEGLAPGQTVTVAQLAGLPERPSCPSFIVERWQLRLPVRLAARAGISRELLLPLRSSASCADTKWVLC